MALVRVALQEHFYVATPHAFAAKEYFRIVLYVTKKGRYIIAVAAIKPVARYFAFLLKAGGNIRTPQYHIIGINFNRGELVDEQGIGGEGKAQVVRALHTIKIIGITTAAAGAIMLERQATFKGEKLIFVGVTRKGGKGFRREGTKLTQGTAGKVYAICVASFALRAISISNVAFVKQAEMRNIALPIFRIYMTVKIVFQCSTIGVNPVNGFNFSPKERFKSSI